jgi:atypical dual specificity phosphatase
VRAWLNARHLSWIEGQHLAGCAYPRNEAAMASLRQHGITTVINLHTRKHLPERLARHGIAEIHLPVADFTAPAPEQLARGVAAIEQALAADQRVAVHCGAGLGRTGTLLACYLVRRGLRSDEAIARIRALRPGAVETRAQEAAVALFAAVTTSGTSDPASARP